MQVHYRIFRNTVRTSHVHIPWSVLVVSLVVGLFWLLTMIRQAKLVFNRNSSPVLPDCIYIAHSPSCKGQLVTKHHNYCPLTAISCKSSSAFVIRWWKQFLACQRQICEVLLHDFDDVKLSSGYSTDQLRQTLQTRGFNQYRDHALHTHNTKTHVLEIIKHG